MSKMPITYTEQEGRVKTPAALCGGDITWRSLSLTETAYELPQILHSSIYICVTPQANEEVGDFWWPLLVYVHVSEHSVRVSYSPLSLSLSPFPVSFILTK